MDKLEIYNQLKEEIIDLKIEPGALISENEISRRFEVSRTPVRDVFLRLCNDGLLEVLPQRGTKVSLIDMELVMATINMRTIVEIQILKDGIERRTPAQLQQLKMDLERQRQAIAQKRTPDEFYALDSEFHEHIFAIARSAGNVANHQSNESPLFALPDAGRQSQFLNERTAS